MKLTRTEKWILSNQYRILDILSPKEAEDFAYFREAIEKGYAHDIDHYCPVYPDNDCLTTDECIEIVRILGMFDNLKSSYDRLSDKTGIDEQWIKFHGFSGNEESKQLSYVRFICDPRTGRFETIDRGDNFDSHAPLLPNYRRMLGVYMPMESKHPLSKEDVKKIIDFSRLH